MNQIAKTPQAQLSHYFTQHKNQLEAALPKHLNPDRMSRLALTAFSQNKALQKCDPKTVFSSIIVLSQLGLEPGIDGQAYLVPYGRTCTPIPGWKGYVDLVSRSGRATVWTGAIFEGDEFDYQLGDSPFLNHRPGDEDDEKKLTHVYAIGRVKGSDIPVIEVWSIKKIIKHRDKYNKVGKGHYSFKNLEMYARKIPLLQVIKYMPKSVELQSAMEIDLSSTEGKSTEYIDGDFMTVDSNDFTNDESAGAMVKKTEPANKNADPEPEKKAVEQQAEQTNDIDMGQLMKMSINSCGDLEALQQCKSDMRDQRQSGALSEFEYKNSVNLYNEKLKQF